MLNNIILTKLDVLSIEKEALVITELYGIQKRKLLLTVSGDFVFIKPNFSISIK